MLLKSGVNVCARRQVFKLFGCDHWRNKRCWYMLCQAHSLTFFRSFDLVSILSRFSFIPVLAIAWSVSILLYDLRIEHWRVKTLKLIINFVSSRLNVYLCLCLSMLLLFLWSFKNFWIWFRGKKQLSMNASHQPPSTSAPFRFLESPGRENYNMKRLVMLVVSITGFRAHLGCSGRNDTILSCVSVFKVSGSASISATLSSPVF